jgi:hypothetical protein
VNSIFADLGSRAIFKAALETFHFEVSLLRAIFATLVFGVQILDEAAP